MALSNEEDLCVETNQFDTPYNDDPLIPAYSGIMFDMSSLVDGIEIWAIEFDVRVEEATSLDVEIFTKPDSFTEDMSDESVWTKVAETQAKAAPDGKGVLISESDFTPIALKSLQRRAIYIQMKGPWIDVKAEALDKTGEQQKKTDEMVVFVGAGVNSRFSDEIDPLVDPQFAGKIHYRRSFPCSDGILTRITLPLLIGQIPNPFFIGLLQDTLDYIIKEEVLQSAHFGELVSQFNLRFGETSQIDTVSSDITCPDDWSYCPSVIMDGTLVLRHDHGLRPGQLRFEIYRAAEAIVSEIRTRLDLDEVTYLGYLPTAASFVMTLDPAVREILDKDISFFEESTTNHLNRELEQNSIEVFDTVTSGFQRRRRSLRRLSTTEMTISGSILGAQAAYLPLSNFIVEMNVQLITHQQLYVDMLRYGVSTLPNGASVSSSAFADLQDVQVSFYYEKVTPASLAAPTSPVFTTKAIRIILSVVLVVALPLIIYFGYKCMKSKNSYRKSLKEYREQMKEFRRSKREDCSVEATTAKSLEENFNTELDAAFELGYEEYKKKVEVCGLNALSHHDLAENETSFHKTSEHGRTRLGRSLSSHSNLSLSLHRLDVESDLEDNLSDSSFGTDANDDGIDDASVVSDARSVTSHQTNKSEKSLLSVFLEKQVEKQQRQGLRCSASSMHNSKNSLENSLKSVTEHVPKRGLSYMGKQHGDTRPAMTKSRSSHVGTLREASPPPRRGASRTKSFDPNIPLDPWFEQHLNEKTKFRKTGICPRDKISSNKHLQHFSTGRQDSRRSLCSSDSKSSSPGLHRSFSHRSFQSTRKPIPMSAQAETSLPESGNSVQSQLSHRLHQLLPPSAQTGQNNRPALRPTRKLSSKSLDLEEDRKESLRIQPRREGGTSLFPYKSSHNISHALYQKDPRPKNHSPKDPMPAPARMPARTKSAPIAPCLQPSLPTDDLLRQRKVLTDEFLDSDDSSTSSTKVVTESSPSSEEEQNANTKRSKSLTKIDLEQFQEESSPPLHNFCKSESALTGVKSLDHKKKKKSSGKKGKKRRNRRK